jgi:hypothetical protein
LDFPKPVSLALNERLLTSVVLRSTVRLLISGTVDRSTTDLRIAAEY